MVGPMNKAVSGARPLSGKPAAIQTGPSQGRKRRSSPDRLRYCPALHVLQFVRVPQTLKVPPAIAAGVTNTIWTMADGNNRGV